MVHGTGGAGHHTKVVLQDQENILEKCGEYEGLMSYLLSLLTLQGERDVNCQEDTQRQPYWKIMTTRRSNRIAHHSVSLPKSGYPAEKHDNTIGHVGFSI